MVTKSLCDVEWITIFFFIGLFILVYGVETTGLLEMLAHQVIELTDGDKMVTAMSILFVSATASAIVDNIPFVATMIPLIKNIGCELRWRRAITTDMVVIGFGVLPGGKWQPGGSQCQPDCRRLCRAFRSADSFSTLFANGLSSDDDVSTGEQHLCLFPVFLASETEKTSRLINKLSDQTSCLSRHKLLQTMHRLPWKPFLICSCYIRIVRY